MKKILVLFIIMLILSSMIINISMSVESLEKFNGSPDGGLTGKDNVTKIMASVLELIRLAGAGIATIILLFIGIKYAIASAGERADIKKYAINYSIGALILFAASGILAIVQKVITEGFNSAG